MPDKFGTVVERLQPYRIYQAFQCVGMNGPKHSLSGANDLRLSVVLASRSFCLAERGVLRSGCRWKPGSKSVELFMAKYAMIPRLLQVFLHAKEP